MLISNYKPASDVLLSSVEDGAVLLHLESGVYFGLNPIGSEIWHMLMKGQSNSECIAQLIASYDLDESTAKRDFENLITELLEQDLINSNE